MVTCPKPASQSQKNTSVEFLLKEEEISFSLDLKLTECEHTDAGGHLVTI